MNVVLVYFQYTPLSSVMLLSQEVMIMVELHRNFRRATGKNCIDYAYGTICGMRWRWRVTSTRTTREESSRKHPTQFDFLLHSPHKKDICNRHLKELIFSWNSELGECGHKRRTYLLTEHHMYKKMISGNKLMNLTVQQLMSSFQMYQKWPQPLRDQKIVLSVSPETFPSIQPMDRNLTHPRPSADVTWLLDDDDDDDDVLINSLDDDGDVH